MVSTDVGTSIASSHTSLVFNTINAHKDIQRIDIYRILNQ